MNTERRARLLAPKGHCRGCGKPVPKGRRTWCSAACVDAALVTLDPSAARQRVARRDRGICARCGFDARRAARVLAVLRRKGGWNRQWWRQRRSPSLSYRDALLFLMDHWAPRKRPHTDAWIVPHLWEADHIVAVVEGGGGCGLENYRTLCIACHRNETRALTARRAMRRAVRPQPDQRG